MTKNNDGIITLDRKDQILISVVSKAIEDNLLAIANTLRAMSKDENGNIDSDQVAFFSYAAGSGISLLADIAEIVTADPDNEEFSKAFDEINKAAEKALSNGPSGGGQ